MELDSLLCTHGRTKIQINDQGFVNEISNNFHKLVGTMQRVTSAYHPQANGMVERVDEEEDIDPDNEPEADLEFCNVELMNASGSLLKSKANICNIKHYFARKDDKNSKVVSYNEELNAQENHLNVKTVISMKDDANLFPPTRVKILNDETKMVELGNHREI
ncbi:unnamed protein product, partial [Gordionus sp. m RMFG-2023]